MRHGDSKRKFGRVSRQRKALLRGLARSLVLSERITTTIAKAKELRPFVERLVTIGKENSLQSQRLLTENLGGARDAAKKIHARLAPRYLARKGGYTRIVRLGRVSKRVMESARIEFIQ